jgi:hypothetical protein
MALQHPSTLLPDSYHQLDRVGQTIGVVSSPLAIGRMERMTPMAGRYAHAESQRVSLCDCANTIGRGEPSN